jgi:hypothetical protein
MEKALSVQLTQSQHGRHRFSTPKKRNRISKATVLGEIQIVSDTWFVKERTPNLERTQARVVVERNNTTG